MSTTLEKNTLLSAKVTNEIDAWLKKYPENQRQSAIQPALRFAQEDNQGWLSNELIEAVADYIGIPHIAAYESATFFSMYELEPVGKHKICVCDNISCKLLGSGDIIKHLEKRLDVKKGGTTKDGLFTLKKVECLGACVDAPMMQIDDREYYAKLTPEKVDQILDEVAKKGGSHGE